MFRLFGIPVTVRPMFLFVTLFLGAASTTDPLAIAIWFVVVFVSILVHELGHALTGRAMGLEPQIMLHGFGGLAIFSNPQGVDVSIPRSVAITLAGPFAGFVFGGLIYLLADLQLVPLDQRYALTAVSYLLWVNIGWGALNLLPIMPLDGGQVVAALLRRVRNGQLTSYLISTSFALAATGAALAFQYWFAAVMAFWLLADNVRDIQTLRHESADAPLWDAFHKAWRGRKKQSHAQLAEELEVLAKAARGPSLQAQLYLRLAELAIDDGDGERANAQFERIPREMRSDPEVQLQMAIIMGRGEEAYQAAKEQYESDKDAHRTYFLQLLTALERYAELSIELRGAPRVDDDAIAIARAAALRALANGFGADAVEIARWLVGQSDDARDAILLAASLWAQGQRDGSLEWFERAARKEPEQFRAWLEEFDGADEIIEHPRVRQALAERGAR